MSAVYTAAFEALGHSGAGGADVALALGIRQGVGRVWPMSREHVAHPFFHTHGFAVGAGGLVGDGQSVGDGVL